MNPTLPDSLRKFRSIFIGGLMLPALASAWAQTADATPYYFTTLAGVSSIGSTDGTGSAVRFNGPEGVAVDGEGNLYVTDSKNHTIRKLTPAGIVSTLAGKPGMGGSADGVGSDARFEEPSNVTVDRAGNLYVADSGNNTIRKITAAGVVSTIAGKPGTSGSADGTGSEARFNRPCGLTVDNTGNLYVADTGNSTIRQITPAGSVTTMAGTTYNQGKTDGTGSAASFNLPEGITVDPTGILYVADTSNDAIRRIAPGGVVTTLLSPDQITHPSRIAIDSIGNLYVTSYFWFEIRPSDIKVEGVFVPDQTIWKITPAGVVSTVAGKTRVAGDTDGAGSEARFSSPLGLAVDSTGTLYVGDSGNNMIRKINPPGTVSTLAGLSPFQSAGSTDGPGFVARFKGPSGLTIDGAGTLYVADSWNNAIRKVTPAGVVSTLAGKPGLIVRPELIGSPGYVSSADGAGSDARFALPYGIAVDPAGNLYVTDSWNCTLRKITPEGLVTTLAGTAGAQGSADGTGPAARFGILEGISVDPAGNLFVSDELFNTIREVTPAGVVTTLDPANSATFSFHSSTNIAIDSAGNRYVASNHTIKKITPAGVETTLAGTVLENIYAQVAPADGIGPDARFSYPSGVAVDSAGNVYVADGNTIRKGQLAGPPMITTQPPSQTVVAGSSVQFSVTAGAVPAPTYQWYFNSSPFSGATTNTLSFANARATDAGDYTVVVTNALGTVTSNKVTLTVSSASVTPPTTRASGGGGGLIEDWFVLALFTLGGAGRLVARRECSPALQPCSDNAGLCGRR